MDGKKFGMTTKGKILLERVFEENEGEGFRIIFWGVRTKDVTIEGRDYFDCPFLDISFEEMVDLINQKKMIKVVSVES